ncbi:hypothetical protein NDU88_004178 [Pleurodeles waltl]|uniref:Uncharacterized protein n=1 Tax=Pleurodeles waltl TaxID=8319 RepID=A0AAV7W7D1_PLEWA|nr:hypothetical protein NDU88_004178 [Pleurodeles waltl]
MAFLRFQCSSLQNGRRRGRLGCAAVQIAGRQHKERGGTDLLPAPGTQELAWARGEMLPVKRVWWPRPEERYFYDAPEALNERCLLFRGLEVIQGGQRPEEYSGDDVAWSGIAWPRMSEHKDGEVLRGRTQWERPTTVRSGPAWCRGYMTGVAVGDSDEMQ